MAKDKHIYGEVDNKSDLKKVFPPSVAMYAKPIHDPNSRSYTSVRLLNHSDGSTCLG
jgi:hypothetical protein